MNRLIQSFLMLTVTAAMAGVAHAEVTTVKIGETFGLTHLPSYIVEDQQLIQKHAAAHGVPDLKVEVNRVSSGTVVTDLLLSGNANVAIAGVIPFITLWDKTTGPQKVRAIAAMSETNIFVMTVDPKINSIADYTDNDRIAMTDPKNSNFSLVLQMAAAEKFGWDNRNKFETLSVGMANGEATAAMLAGGTEVKSHMCALPFTELERQSGKIRPILNSRDVLGGPLISAVAFTTQKFEDENPNVAIAISEAFDEAMDFIAKNPEQAAEIYNKHEPQKAGVPFILKMMDPNSPDQLRYSSAPKAFKVMADFMFKSGMVKHQVNSWKDFFVERAWSKDGS